MRLLKSTTDNPIGMQDYVAFFQIGWLLWKHEHDIVAAEDAFYRAQRLSSSKRDLYHALSLRHPTEAFSYKSARLCEGFSQDVGHDSPTTSWCVDEKHLAEEGASPAGASAFCQPRAVP